MAGNVVDWVANKINPEDGLKVIDRTPEDFLVVKYKDGRSFPVAVVGVQNVVLPEHVQSVLSQATKPEFVVNVPSKTLWSGEAISIVHSAPAAFGTLGDLMKASRQDDVPGYRNKTWDFFEQAIRQHSNVDGVTRIYDGLFEAHRRTGGDLKIALVDAYNMSAEDVRSARNRFGAFDIAVKMTTFGSITNAAEEAAASMGAAALMFKGLMRRLAR